MALVHLGRHPPILEPQVELLLADAVDADERLTDLKPAVTSSYKAVGYKFNL